MVGINSQTTSAMSHSSLVGAPKVVPPQTSFTNLSLNVTVNMTKNEWSPRSDKVDVAVTVDIKYARTTDRVR